MDAVARLVPALLLIVGGLLAVRWWAQNRAGQRGTGRLRITARAVLGRNAVIAVVEVDERRFLVGAGESGVRLVSELGPEPLDDGSGAAPGVMNGSSTAATDGRRDGQRPGIGVVERLRAMTLRTYVDRPSRVPRS